jgi:hypothetical protein
VTRATSELTWRRLTDGRRALASLPKLPAGFRPPGDTRDRPPTAKGRRLRTPSAQPSRRYKYRAGQPAERRAAPRGPTERRWCVDAGRTFDRGPCPAFAHLLPNSGPKPCSGPDFHFWRVTQTSSRARGPPSRCSSPDAHAVYMMPISPSAARAGIAGRIALPPSTRSPMSGLDNVSQGVAALVRRSSST